VSAGLTDSESGADEFVDWVRKGTAQLLFSKKAVCFDCWNNILKLNNSSYGRFLDKCVLAGTDVSPLSALMSHAIAHGDHVAMPKSRKGNVPSESTRPSAQSYG